MRRSEPKTSVHSSKGRWAVTRTGPPLVALAANFEEQFGAGAGERHEAHLVDDQQVERRQLSLQIQQPSLTPGLYQLMDQTGGAGEALGHTLLIPVFPSLAGAGNSPLVQAGCQGDGCLVSKTAKP